MSAAVLDALPALRLRALHRLGLDDGDARAFVAALPALDNTVRVRRLMQVAQACGHDASARWARDWLTAFGLWAHERCARQGCGREVGARHRCVIVHARAYCSPGCALVGIGAAS